MVKGEGLLKYQIKLPVPAETPFMTTTAIPPPWASEDLVMLQIGRILVVSEDPGCIHLVKSGDFSPCSRAWCFAFLYVKIQSRLVRRAGSALFHKYLGICGSRQYIVPPPKHAEQMKLLKFIAEG